MRSFFFSTSRSFSLSAGIAIAVTVMTFATNDLGQVSAESLALPAGLSVEAAPGVEGGWIVRHDDQFFAGYLPNFKGTPIVYPILGPKGHRMTRDFPMSDQTAAEKHDHPHHRALWFTHGDVNGVDFWATGAGKGRIVQTAGEATANPEAGTVVLETKNDWLAPDGERLLTDVRTLTFRVEPGQQIIDFDVVLHATDGDVNFGDTKEGSFGIRVPGTMKVDAKRGGRITNAEGLIDGKAWAQASNWVNYTGPVASVGSDGMETVGITIFCHPSSYSAPQRWHVRSYGLFAANPFGVHHFIGGEPTEGTTIADGDHLPLRYRLVFSVGDFDAKKVADAYEAYAKNLR